MDSNLQSNALVKLSEMENINSVKHPKKSLMSFLLGLIFHIKAKNFDIVKFYQTKTLFPLQARRNEKNSGGGEGGY